MQVFQAIMLTAAILFVVLMVVGLVTLILPVMMICGAAALVFLLIYQWLKINKPRR